MNLGQFDKKTLKSIENEVTEDKSEPDVPDDTGREGAQRESLVHGVPSGMF